MLMSLRQVERAGNAKSEGHRTTHSHMETPLPKDEEPGFDGQRKSYYHVFAGLPTVVDLPPAFECTRPKNI